MRVAPAAVATLAQHNLLPFRDHLGDGFFRREIDHDGAQRHLEDAGLAITSMAVGALAMLTALTFPVGLKLVVDEIVGVHITKQDDVAPATAIAAIGATPR